MTKEFNTFEEAVSWLTEAAENGAVMVSSVKTNSGTYLATWRNG